MSNAEWCDYCGYSAKGEVLCKKCRKSDTIRKALAGATVVGGDLKRKTITIELPHSVAGLVVGMDVCEALEFLADKGEEK